MKKLSTLLIAVFALILVAFGFFGYTVLQERVIEEERKQKQEVVAFLQKSFNALRVESVENFRDSLQGSLKSTYLQGVAFEFKTLRFDRENLFELSGEPDESWSITDVSCDASFVR